MDSEPPCKRICLENRYEGVGIEAFVSKNTSEFTGIIKERWEDFVVHEVGLDGKVVIYDCVEVESTPKDKEETENKYLNQTTLDKLKSAVKSVGECEVVFNAPEDKSERRAVHEYIKKEFVGLTANTEERDGVRVFVVINREDERARIARRNAVQSGDGKYAEFVLHKSGVDTISAVSIISKHVRMKPGNFTYAGTKDRRGITTQKISVRGCALAKLRGVNKCLRNMYVGNLQYKEQPLHLGDLQGNRFSLVVRDLRLCNGDDAESTVAAAVKQFAECGFVNYFGLQRFGSSAVVRTHELGRLAVASDWAALIAAVMQPCREDLPAMRTLKEGYAQDRSAAAFVAGCKNSGGCWGIECNLMEGVERHGLTLNAIEKLPRNLRQLYVHSYQSLLWNKVASRRMQTNPSVMIGDLVAVGDSPDETDCQEKGKVTVRVVANEAELNSYSLQDILLPLPGFDVTLPANETGTWLKELLEKDGLSLEMLKHNVKDFSLPGAYRKLIALPEDVTFKVHRYEDGSIPLIETDRQKMIIKSEQTDETGFKMPSSEGSKLALIIDMTLAKSCYATIAMRELLRSETVVF